MSKYAKAITAAVGAVVVILGTQGVVIADDISASVITLLTALAVLLVPNAE